MATNAEANGWRNDKAFVASLNEIATTMEDCLKNLKDPTMLESSDITQADVDEYVGLLNEFLPILKDTQKLVAVPVK